MIAGVKIKEDIVINYFDVTRLDRLSREHILDPKFELELFLKECIDEYDKDEYRIIDGEHVVKILPP